MIQEYIKAILQHPMLFLKTKWLNFENLLSIRFPHYWFYLGVNKLDIEKQNSTVLTNNSEQLIQNTTFNKIRSKIFYFSIAVADNIWTRIFSGINAIWLIINIASIITLSFFAVKKKVDYFTLIISLFPFFYYSSYLVATTAHDFRFMYPATLVMQILILSFLFSCVLNLKLLFTGKRK